MSDYITAKLAWAILLVVGLGLAAFFYRLFTGRDIRDLFRDKSDGSK